MRRKSIKYFFPEAVLKKLFCVIALIYLFSIGCNGQSNSFFAPSATLNNGRLLPLTVGEGAFYAGSMTGLYMLWYKKYPHSSFHFFNDNKEWQQMDKVGHSFTAYTISRLAAALYQWSGIKPLPAAAYGTSVGMAFQTNIEVFDGFSSQWGFSAGDMIANTAGASIFLSQAAGWGDQRVMIKLSFHPTQYSQYRPDELGQTAFQQMIKDYNGQTYWAAIAIAAFLPKGTKVPGWACLDFGYSAEGMIGAVTNPAISDSSGHQVSFDRYRKYFVSLDVNLTKIPTNSAPLRAFLGAISFIKIPFPTLEYSRKKFRFYWLYF